eukprot:XP_020407820.1 uncharacterized protein LOC109945862 [Zea mays]
MASRQGLLPAADLPAQPPASPPPPSLPRHPAAVGLQVRRPSPSVNPSLLPAVCSFDPCSPCRQQVRHPLPAAPPHVVLPQTRRRPRLQLSGPRAGRTRRPSSRHVRQPPTRAARRPALRPDRRSCNRRARKPPPSLPMADHPQDAPTTGLAHPPLTAGLGATPASLAAGVASLGLPAAGQTHPMGPGRSVADAEAPYIVGLWPLRGVPSPAHRRGSPPGFPALAAPPGTDSSLDDTFATIQAAVMASRERERAASLALERERALGAALTTQMVTTQRLLGRPPVAPVDHPADPRDSDLDADLIVALHAQVVGLHNIRALVSVVLDPASSHYPRWRGQVLLTLRRFVLDDHVLVDHDAPPPRSWRLSVAPPGQRRQGCSGAQAGRTLGILGSSPQAHTAFAPLQASSSSSNTSTSTWDAAGLIAALQNMQLQGNSP